MTITPQEGSGNENTAEEVPFANVDDFPDGDEIDSASVSVDPLDYVPPSTTEKEVC